MGNSNSQSVADGDNLSSAVPSVPQPRLRRFSLLFGGHHNNTHDGQLPPLPPNTPMSVRADVTHLFELATGATHAFDNGTAERYAAVLSSWSSVDIANAGGALSKKLVELYPHLEEHVTVFGDAKRQSTRLLQMIDEGLRLFSKPEVVVPELFSLGVRHPFYGVEDEHYDAVGAAFIQALPTMLPSAPSPDLLHAYETAFGVMAAVMKQGAASPTGKVMSEQCLHRQATTLMLQWNKIKSVDGFISTFTEELKRRKFATDKMHCLDNHKFVSAIDDALRALATSVTGAGSRLFEGIGCTHAGARVGEHDYCTLVDAFVSAITKTLPCAAAEGPHAWRHVFWKTAVFHMQRGGDGGVDRHHGTRAPAHAPFVLIFTDVEGATRLAAKNTPQAMERAMAQHDRLLHRVIQANDGYIAKEIGCARLIACGDLRSATEMALQFQLALHKATWEPIEDVPRTGTGPDDVWNPFMLRVRIGLHLCSDVRATYDSMTSRFAYVGNEVSVTSRVSDRANGGQIAMTKETLEVLEAMDPQPDTPFVSRVYTENIKNLEGDGVDHTLYTLLPALLSKREFPTVRD